MYFILDSQNPTPIFNQLPHQSLNPDASPRYIILTPPIVPQSLILNKRITDPILKDPSCSCLSFDGQSIIVITSSYSNHSVFEFDQMGTRLSHHQLRPPSYSDITHNIPIKVALTRTEKLFVVKSSSCYLNVNASTILKVYSGNRESNKIKIRIFQISVSILFLYF